MTREDLSAEDEQLTPDSGPEDVAFFLAAIGTKNLVELKPVDYVTAPDGSIGLSLGWLGRLAKEEEQNSILWIQPNLNNEPDEALVSLAGGAVQIDFDSQEVIVDGDTKPITTKQFEILQLLAKNKGKVVTREKLMDEIWGEWYGSRYVLTVHISGIRRNILGDWRGLLKTRRGSGYVLVDSQEPKTE